MQSDTLQNQATIRLVRPGEFSEDTAQTPGSRRLGAIAQDRGIPSSMWGGLFTVPAGGQTAIHHHGKQDTVVYVLWGHGPAPLLTDVFLLGDVLRGQRKAAGA
jgi:uncharacterized RmlC-like cupin family protein